jgi:hypothetical protein
VVRAECFLVAATIPVRANGECILGINLTTAIHLDKLRKLLGP